MASLVIRDVELGNQSMNELTGWRVLVTGATGFIGSHLAAEGQLMMYRHTGFWQSMDTFKDAQVLTELWETSAPWQVW